MKMLRVLALLSVLGLAAAGPKGPTEKVKLNSENRKTAAVFYDEVHAQTCPTTFVVGQQFFWCVTGIDATCHTIPDPIPTVHSKTCGDCTAPPDTVVTVPEADKSPRKEYIQGFQRNWLGSYDTNNRKDIAKLDGYCNALRLAQQTGMYRRAGNSQIGRSTFKDRTFECEDLDEEVGSWLAPAIIGVAVALLMVVVFTLYVLKTAPGNEDDVQLRKIAEYVHEGASTFLIKEYQWLVVFVVLLVTAMAILFATPKEVNKLDDLGWLYVSIAIIVGSTFSACAGYLGMFIATKANIRTAHACRTGLGTGLNVAFRSGAVMGLTVTGLGLLGLIIFTASFRTLLGEWNYIAGFGMGGSAIALFARVGGGIYTKAADVGADLVGKVENNIPEDDARNPAVIADNVGDNVGDVAGMGADLFESYAGSVIAAATLAHHNLVSNMTVLEGIAYANHAMGCPDTSAAYGRAYGNINVGEWPTAGAYFVEHANAYDVASVYSRPDFAALPYFVQKKIPFLEMDLAYSAMALPFWVAGTGIVCSVVGIFAVRASDAADDGKKLDDAQKRKENLEQLESLLRTMLLAVIVAGICVTGLSLLCCILLFTNDSTFTYRIWGCIIIGLVSGVLIGQWTEYCTSYSYMPTMSIAEKSDTGPATVIIQGMGVGMISCVVPTVLLLIAVVWTNHYGGVYGVAIAAVGMLSTLGVTLATDAYGPVADNAGGLAEMCDIEEIVRERTDALDALGNTTAATGKGFAIGSAVLTSVGLVAAFMEETGLQAGDVDLQNADVLVGILFGAMLPFLFGALTMLSVGRAAEQIILQVRKQFYEVLEDLKKGVYKHPDGRVMVWKDWDPKYLPQKPGNTEQTVNAYYNECITISTTSSLQEMLIPGIMAVLSPAIIGFLLGAPALAGLLGGALTSGFMLAITMANAGGAWDNAKKYCEKDGLGPGKGKNTDNHAACVVGDTVGDPFKDTSGPALNILIKLMSIVSLVLAPTFKNCCQESFSDEGIGAGLGLLVAAIIICVGLQMWMDRKNAAWKEMIERQAEEVKRGAVGLEPSPETKNGAAEEEKPEKVTGAHIVPVGDTPGTVSNPMMSGDLGQDAMTEEDAAADALEAVAMEQGTEAKETEAKEPETTAAVEPETTAAVSTTAVEPKLAEAEAEAPTDQPGDATA